MVPGMTSTYQPAVYYLDSVPPLHDKVFTEEAIMGPLSWKVGRSLLVEDMSTPTSSACLGWWRILSLSLSFPPLTPLLPPLSVFSCGTE